MSNNVPWIEKYQPNNLDEIHGNKEIIDRFKNMIKNKNMSNMIISGPPGIGKTRSIHCMSKEILGKNNKEAILELNGSEDRGIGVVRVNIKLFAQKKFVLDKGLYKIIILDEADSMTAGSQQALRTIIEEYSNNTRFVFICNDHSKILEPIQSRCVLLKMNSLSSDDIFGMLQIICNKENVEYTQEGLQKIADISNEDMRQAINNLQNTYYCFKTINEENVEEICDTTQEKLLSTIINNCSEKNIYTACEIVKELHQSGYSCDDIINMIFNFVKNTELIEEYKKIIFIKELSLTSLSFHEGYTTILQLYGLMGRLCNVS